ncbi:MAG: HAMP domain-containing protein [Desulfobacteraceae bacterium]|nr:MAG: HAMP domain-containing protein [Desulfobacteraceae bacterium]
MNKINQKGDFRMRKSFHLTGCIAFIILLLCAAAVADETMDQIANTGKIRIGWRANSPPFAFFDNNANQHVGFSVDMGYYIAELLSESLGKKITVEPVTVTSQNRLAFVKENKIDIEMGSTSFTKSRNEEVDFSIFFFFSETTFLVPNASPIKTLEDLNGKKIGATKDTSNLTALKTKQEDKTLTAAAIVEFDDHPPGFKALQAGKIDAYCTDRSLLEGLRIKTPNPEEWRILDFAIAYDPYAFMMRENNSDFRNFVNNAIVWSIRTGKYYEMYDKWMGTKPVKKLETSSQKIRQTAINTNIIIVAVSIILIIWLVFFYGRRLTGRIRYLSNVADRISVGELDTEIQVTSKDEIGELAESIARMQDSLRLSLDRLRRK